MTYGEAIRLLFDAACEDWSRKDYSNSSLEEAIEKVPLKSRRNLATVFANIVNLLRRNIAKCPHPIDSVHRPYNGREECTLCGSVRIQKKNDDYDSMGWGGQGEWEEWLIYV